MHLNQYVWWAKRDIDFIKYGFKEIEYYFVYEINDNYRIYISKKELRVEFRQLTNDAMVKVAELIKDNIIYYTSNIKVKEKHLITREEWEVIKKMRGDNNDTGR